MSRSGPCFVALCAASLLLAACSKPSSDDAGAGAGMSWDAPPAASVAQVAQRLATSIPKDAVPCASLEGLRAAHKHLDDPDVVVEPERPTGSVAARTSALRTLLADRRFARVQWDAATLTAAHVQADPARAVLTLRFPRPMDVPTILGLPAESPGGATDAAETITEETRPLTAKDAERFATALEVAVTVDLSGRPPTVASIDPRTIPTMCLLSEVPPSLR